eukprot:172975-Hanusia_phi.AAC.4
MHKRSDSHSRNVFESWHRKSDRQVTHMPSANGGIHLRIAANPDSICSLSPETVIDLRDCSMVMLECTMHGREDERYTSAVLHRLNQVDILLACWITSAEKDSTCQTSRILRAEEVVRYQKSINGADLRLTVP